MSVWKAVHNSLVKRDGNVIANVTFSNDTTPESFSQDIPANDLSPDTLAQFCQNLCIVYEKRDASFTIFTQPLPAPVVLPRDKPVQPNAPVVAPTLMQRLFG